MNRTCPTCKLNKPIDQFNSQGKYCKPCHAERNRIWRERNPEKNKAARKRYNDEKRVVDPEASRRYQQKFYQENKEKVIAQNTANKKASNIRNTKFVIEYLKEHPCVDCGEARPLRLTFDHVRGEKSASIGGCGLQLGWSIKRLKQEIEKCEVRCFNCHMEKTSIERAFVRARLVQEEEVDFVVAAIIEAQKIDVPDNTD